MHSYILTGTGRRADDAYSICSVQSYLSTENLEIIFPGDVSSCISLNQEQNR